jgi:hypothetical protein
LVHAKSREVIAKEAAIDARLREEDLKRTLKRVENEK